MDMKYDKRISNDEKQILEAKTPVITDALPEDSVFWKIRRVDNGVVFQLLNFNNPTEGYFEAPLEAIDNMDIDEFANAIAFKSYPPTVKVTAESLIERYQDWHCRLTELFEQIKTWAEDFPTATSSWSTVMPAQEYLLDKFKVKPIELPTLVIYVEKNGVSQAGACRFTPSSLFVVAANGRVNVNTNKNQYILVDLSVAWLESQWTLYEKNKNFKETLSENTIHRLLSECQ